MEKVRVSTASTPGPRAPCPSSTLPPTGAASALLCLRPECLPKSPGLLVPRQPLESGSPYAPLSQSMWLSRASNPPPTPTAPQNAGNVVGEELP